MVKDIAQAQISQQTQIGPTQHYKSRDCHGLPWGFSRQPVPIPVKTRTRTKCMGFYTYGSRVGYNPRVSKPVQIKAWVHIKSGSNVEKNYLMSR